MEHINENVEYGLEITGIFKDPLTRQANESVRIYNRKGTEILNSKADCHHPSLWRVRRIKQEKFTSPIWLVSFFSSSNLIRLQLHFRFSTDT